MFDDGSGPLEGIRVLDLTRLLPGPYLTLLFADLGADVIKVEAPGGGDWVRYVPPLVPGTGTSVQFVALNRGKRSVVLDLKSPDGADALRRLVMTADVLVESSRPGVMDRLGLGEGALRALNPRLIVASLTGYGQTGPFRDRAGHDLNYSAIGGTATRTGVAGGGPVALGFQVADIGGALHGAIAILAALVGRSRHGRGAALDISLAEGAMAMNALALPSALNGSDEPRGTGMLDGGAPGYAFYECADGRFLAVAPLEHKFWASFCQAMGRLDWTSRQHGDPTLKDELARVFLTESRDEWASRLASSDACVEPVLELSELDTHPLHVARELFFTLSQGGHPVRHVRTPGLSPRLAPTLRPAPGLGEHTADILAELEGAPESN